MALIVAVVLRKTQTLDQKIDLDETLVYLVVPRAE